MWNLLCVCIMINLTIWSFLGSTDTSNPSYNQHFIKQIDRHSVIFVYHIYDQASKNKLLYCNYGLLPIRQKQDKSQTSAQILDFWSIKSSHFICSVLTNREAVIGPLMIHQMKATSVSSQHLGCIKARFAINWAIGGHTLLSLIMKYATFTQARML